jgi:4-aminobutyrate aminotransferase-like enzyme
MENGMLILQCGTYHQVIRWIPPLIVTEEQLRQGLAIFERAVIFAEEKVLKPV